MNDHTKLLDLDLKSSSIYLAPDDVNLGITFQQKMEVSKLSPAVKNAITVRCIKFTKEVLTQYQMRLPESMDMLRKMELFSPKTMMSDDQPRVKELPMQFFTSPVDVLETQWRSVASCTITEKCTLDEFWLKVIEFTDAGRNHCFKELALGAIKLITLTISNAHVERAFSQVALLKDDTRN
ncbi:UNVERIFIED_CONTAM: hypothetical protein FKN15_012045 [Acipenser sinensis]